MWNFATLVSSALFTILVIAPVRGAQGAQCTTVYFPDALGVANCINDNVNLCSISETDEHNVTHKIAECFTRSAATPTIAFMVLNGLREVVLMGMKLASPNAAHFFYPLLRIIAESIQQETLQERSFPQTLCDRRIAVNFTNVANIAQCALPIQVLCQRLHHLNNAEVSALLVSTFVCVYKKFPQFNIGTLMREVACMVLELVVGAMKRRHHFYTMLPALELTQLVLKCNVHEIVSPNAERRLLDELNSKV